MKTNPFLRALPALAAAACAALPLATPAAAPPAADDAAVFGEMEKAGHVALSADGLKLAFTGSGGGMSTVAVVVDLVNPQANQIARADGDPMSLVSCDWSALDRLVCTLYGLTKPQSILLPTVRLMAMNADGSKQLALGQRGSLTQLGRRQFDGSIVDWLNGTDGNVLMSRYYVPELTTGALNARREEGLGVDRVDTRTGKVTVVERPGASALDFMSDGLGNVRLMTTSEKSESGDLKGTFTHYYRAAGEREWKRLGATLADEDAPDSMTLVGVDPIVNAAYVGMPLDGRQALYRIALDGSMKKELVFASKEVDVDGVVRVGRGGRIIGATYVTDRRQVEYFDPAYKAIAASLAKALPKTPLIRFESASADEQILAVWVGSDVDPGRYYVYDRQKRTLSEVVALRPNLKGRQLAPMQSITFPAADGTQIPAYLTLPPGVTDPKGLPAIVMPHGGPSYRDEWGFDWLVQFYAARGYVVLQPNYRGSSGYGDQWYMDNGFKSWKTSIGDVCDAGRWLVKQGIADASKLAIVGWSYGGYAALQAQVLDPTLFKAAVAVAPVTDLSLLKAQAQTYTNGDLVAQFVGSGAHVTEGSPADNAKAFQAPVLMFHGDLDLNVHIDQARRMDRALRSAGKQSELIVYPKLEHSLRDSNVRADLLRKSDAFLRQHLKL